MVARENVADIVAMPRAYTVEETRGVMKFILDADTDLILGARDSQHRRAGSHQHASPSRCVRASPPTELTNAIYTHPSTTEALNEVFGKIVA